MKKLNYNEGVLKRKFKMGKVDPKPGDFITKMNELKRSNIKSNTPISKKRLAIMGLI